MVKVLELLIIGAGALAIRAIVSLQPYSGYNSPPMYGDFEAQRHWQEITVNLPITQWYAQTKDNDLKYWGLDYPPLTAYHSYLMGLVAKKINSSYVELHKSRGITTPIHKMFMRSTVLVADLLIYIPALLLAIAAVWRICKEKNQFRAAELLPYFIALYFPGQILIDNGHFQYNNVSLGLACLAIFCILVDLKFFGAAFFVLALNYKQMELYHALPFFFYLLVKCFYPGFEFKNAFLKKSSAMCAGLIQLIGIAFIVGSLFLLIWQPFLYNFIDAWNTLSRVFPFSRGVFEDKVANFWCLVHIFDIVKHWLANFNQVLICTVCTLLSITPSCLHLATDPRKSSFILSLINVSLGFFLFSYQVHEKTILVTCLPVILCFAFDPLVCLWFLQIATFSMTPLLIRDGLLLSYVLTSGLYLLIIRLIGGQKEQSPPKQRLSFDVFNIGALTNKDYLVFPFYLSAIVGCAILVAGLAFIPPPAKFPHLFPVLIAVYSCLHFLLFFAYFNIRQFVGYYDDEETGVFVFNFKKEKKTKKAEKLENDSSETKEEKKTN